MAVLYAVAASSNRLNNSDAPPDAGFGGNDPRDERERTLIGLDGRFELLLVRPDLSQRLPGAGIARLHFQGASEPLIGVAVKVQRQAIKPQHLELDRAERAVLGRFFELRPRFLPALLNEANESQQRMTVPGIPGGLKESPRPRFGLIRRQARRRA